MKFWRYAIARGAMDDLRDELGDLLFQVVYHTQMARESDHFGMDEVIDGICQKMIRRHPHVFGQTEVASAQAQTVAWEAHKEVERAAGGDHRRVGSGTLDGVAKGLPALLRAQKLQARAARVGFDWPDAAGAFEKLREELGELAEELDKQPDEADGKPSRAKPNQAIAEELGDLLFSVVNLARKLDLDAETVLRQGNAKFEDRFGRVETALALAGKSPGEADLNEMEALWVAAKLDK
ncbi:MAG: nucleoside triphosphate pyrophosphohydrolase [Rhodospirillales bacterium]|nr:nucleoside triphosphate pyrophosphohydrolase [Rhodospirillales bacterium]